MISNRVAEREAAAAVVAAWGTYAEAGAIFVAATLESELMSEARAETAKQEPPLAQGEAVQGMGSAGAMGVPEIFVDAAGAVVEATTASAAAVQADCEIWGVKWAGGGLGWQLRCSQNIFYVRLWYQSQSDYRH
jgi:hypothetical protein